MSLWDLVPSQMQAISNVNIEQWMVSTKHTTTPNFHAFDTGAL